MTVGDADTLAQRQREAERPLAEHLAWLERAGRLALWLASEASRSDPPAQRPRDRVTE